MKKIARIILCGWVLCALLSGTGARAAQEPKRFTVEKAMRLLESTVNKTDQPDLVRQALRARLEDRARSSADGNVDYSEARKDLNEIWVGGPVLVPASMPVGGREGEEKEAGEDDGGDDTALKPSKKPEIKIAEQVEQFLPKVIAQMVGSYMPLHWNMRFGPDEQVRALDPNMNFVQVKTAADGRYLAAERLASLGVREIMLWDMVSMGWDASKTHAIKEADPLIWDISPKGDMLAYQLVNKEGITLVSLAVSAENRLNRVIKADKVDSLSFSLNGEEIIGYNSGQGFIFRWNLVSGELVNRKVSDDLPAGERKPTGGLADKTVLSSNGTRMAIVGDKFFEVWDLNPNTLLKKINIEEGRKLVVHSAVFDGEGNRIAIVSEDIKERANKFLGIWDVASGSLELDYSLAERKGSRFYNKMAFSPDEFYLATVFYGAGILRILNLPFLKQKYAPKAPEAEESKIEAELEAERKQQAAVPIPGSGQGQSGPSEPVRRVTVDDFMATLEVEGVALMEEDQLDDVRKQLRELAQTSPDGKIEEALAQQITDDVLRAVAPRELAGQSDEDMPSLEEVDEKEDAAVPIAGAPVISLPTASRRITAKQAQKEFVEFSTVKKRSLWAQGLQDLAASSSDKKINYEDAWQLYEEIKNR
jgi:WD40 repeat protein